MHTYSKDTNDIGKTNPKREMNYSGEVVDGRKFPREKNVKTTDTRKDVIHKIGKTGPG